MALGGRDGTHLSDKSSKFGISVTEVLHRSYAICSPAHLTVAPVRSPVCAPPPAAPVRARSDFTPGKRSSGAGSGQPWRGSVWVPEDIYRKGWAKFASIRFSRLQVAYYL
jgi:hypothetical protein